MYVYIAGPYTKGDVAQNVRNVLSVADELLSYGYVPYVPHLTHFWHLVFPHDIDIWYNYDIEWLKKCDVVIRLFGDSTGADNEVKIAKELGIPVYFGLSEFAKAMIRREI